MVPQIYVGKCYKCLYLSSLYYELLITRILLDYSIDLSEYSKVEVSATSDYKTFTNIGYVLLDIEWYKRESAKEKTNLHNVRKHNSNYVLPVIK